MEVQQFHYDNKIVKNFLYATILWGVVGMLGTLPLMTATIYFSFFFKNTLKNRLQKIIPVFVILLGLLFILRGLGLGIPYISPAPVLESVNQATIDCQ